MGALTLGPIVLSVERAVAGFGFVVLLLAAELLARRAGPALAAWAWRAAAVTFVAARLGFVLGQLDAYAAAPWTALAFWQGGFIAWWGVAAAAAWTAVEAVRTPALRRWAPSVGAAALLAWWLPANLLTPTPEAIGVTAPSIVLDALEGAPVALAATGAPTIVNVWATWCPPCRRELPAFADVAAANPDVRVLLANQGEDAGTVAAFLGARGLPPRGVLLDRGQAVSRALQVVGLPTTFAFDAEGRLVDVHVGEISRAALQQLVARLR